MNTLRKSRTNSQAETDMRVSRLKAFENQGITPYPGNFTISHTLKQVNQIFNPMSFAGEAVNLSVYGRIMSVRKSGIDIFLEIEDQDAGLLVAIRADAVAGAGADNLPSVLPGDYAGFHVNSLFQSQTGELTARAAQMVMLGPCLLPLSRQGSGAQPSEFQPVVDAWARQRITTRSQVVRSVRRFLEDEHDFEEVKAPAGFHPASASSVVGQRGDGRTYLKRLIAGGMRAVYEIFDEPRESRPDRPYTPEIQVMECCIAPAGLAEMMSLAESLIAGIAAELTNHGLPRTSRYSMKKRSERRDEQFQAGLADGLEDLAVNLNDDFDAGDDLDGLAAVDMTPPWQRRPVYDLVREVTGMDFRRMESIEVAAQVAGWFGVTITPDMPILSAGGVVVELLNRVVLPRLTQPTFVVDYPYEEYPFARKHRNDERLVERCEIIINGVSVGHACTELTDPRELQAAQRLHEFRSMDDSAQVDETYLTALKYGLPPTAGLRLDITRLVAMMTGARERPEVIFFPRLGRQRS